MRKRRVRAPRTRSRSRSRAVMKRHKPAIKNVTFKEMQSRVMGNVMPVTMHYVQRVDLNPGLGGITSSYVFRLGSVFDPDLTGVGHQPLGHDEMSAIFERYQVYKVDFHVEFVNLDNTNPQLVGYRIGDSNSTTADYIRNLENGMAEWKIISAATGSDVRVFKGSVYLHEVHGVSYRQFMANDDYGASFGSNPSEDCFIFVMADGLGIDTGAVTCMVHFVYHVKLMGSILTTVS